MSDKLEFDREIFRGLRAELGEADTNQVLKMFLADTASKLTMLEANCQARGTLQREAHAIKSSAATFGFNHMSGLAKDLEREAETIALAQLPESVRELREAFAAVVRFSQASLLSGEREIAP